MEWITPANRGKTGQLGFSSETVGRGGEEHSIGVRPGIEYCPCPSPANNGKLLTLWTQCPQ